MLGRTISRLLLGMAILSGAAAWLGTQRRRRSTTRAHRPPAALARRERYSDRPLGPDGRLDDDALADEASKDSFPASDPPARMGALVPGAPPRRVGRGTDARRRPATEPARHA